MGVYSGKLISTWKRRNLELTRDGARECALNPSLCSRESQFRGFRRKGGKVYLLDETDF